MKRMTMHEQRFGLRNTPYVSGVLVLLAMLAPASHAIGHPSATCQRITYRIWGLCCRERGDDLRAAVKTMPEVTLLGIDFENAEATFLYDPVKCFPGERAERFTACFDNLLRTASSHTFGINLAPVVPEETRTRVVIPVVGLDCKGCCLGAYNAIYRIDGVQRATASFKEGRVTALIDPSKTNRAALETALKNAGVTLKTP